MADSVTTGSIMGEGLTKGLPSSIMASGTYAGVSPTFTIVTFSPNNYLTSTTGSDIAYSISDGVFYIGDITLGAGGSGWTALKTV